MRNFARTLAAAALAAGVIWSGPALAFGRGGGGFHGGGFHGGGFHGGGFHGGGFRGGPYGFRGGFWGGYPGWWDYGYGYDYGYPGYWDYPYASRPYDYPPGLTYDGAIAPADAAPRGVSRFCATQPRICLLPRPGRVGAACSCRVENGIARGHVAAE